MTWRENSQEIKATYDRDGYVILPGFLSLQEIEKLEAEVDRYRDHILPTIPTDQAFYEVGSDNSTMLRMQGMQGHDAYFGNLMSEGSFPELARLLVESPVVVKNLQWFDKPPKANKETPPHQDGYYFHIEPVEAITMWLALDHADEENGCVRYLAGSHKLGMRKHQQTDILGFSQGITNYGPEDLAAEITAPATPGDMIVHTALTVHRADANNSANHRRSLGFVYFSERAKVNTESMDDYQEKLNKKWKEEGRI